MRAFSLVCEVFRSICIDFPKNNNHLNDYSVKFSEKDRTEFRFHYFNLLFAFQRCISDRIIRVNRFRMFTITCRIFLINR